MLAQLRRRLGLSQERLGFEAGFDRSYISQLERGRKSPTLDTLFSLSRVLDVSFSQLAKLIQAKLEEPEE
ncbi:helix-turn-helix transcriptional regulator [Pseudomonas sp. PDM20]|uniref:helix-turn-helix domain-containing protein n=1 Tax=Pseudomonas sp. PDM20 TaxID=2769254 RepID=UPI00298CE340|nr:helix-turn-helix transcriptional regulator [Pseudomonas sp. PDM20]